MTSPRTTPAVSPSDQPRLNEQADAVWPHILEALKELRFGQVTITVQDGHVVQIDRTEKRRFQQTPRAL